MNPYSVEASGNVLTVKFPEVSGNWQQTILLRSDAHHDSLLCRRQLEFEHLQQAKQRDALILDGGDCFDAMQGRNDKRSSYDELRDEDKGDDYLGNIVRHAAEHYKPYAQNWLMLAKGNHETGVLNKANIDLTTLLQDKLKEAGSKAAVGAYAGWIRFRFQIQETVQQTIVMRYYHGAGGNSPVTKGVLDVNRQAVYLPDADIVWNGHNHQAYLMPIARERINSKGRVYQDMMWFVRTPGYKDPGAWETMRGFAPAPKGAAWVTFYLDPGASIVRLEARMDLQ